MNPVRAAIWAALNGDLALANLSTGVHHRRAPQGSPRPYTIFQKQAGTRIWSMRSALKNEVWFVKGVCRGADAEEAEAIDARCVEILTDLEIAIEGHEPLYLRPEDDREYSEPDEGGALLYHVGTYYRLITQPSA